MTEIPDNVMKAAVVAFNTAIDMDGYEGSYEVIARAILAESERCSELMKNPASVRINYLRGDIAMDSIIDEAVARERERCAKVAYAYADAHTSDHKMIGHIIGRKILFDTVDDGS